MAIPINEDPYHAHSHINWPKDIDQLPILFYRPKSLEDIVCKTKFTRREIQLIYRSFKNLCPKGIIEKHTFQEVYASFFPHGESKHYSCLVFKTLDRDFNSFINFEEFVIGLSAITRGSIEEKLDWIFSLYDVHNKGYITEAEVSLVTESIYALLSKHMHGQAPKDEILRHSQEVFQRLTNNGRHRTISRSQFREACLTNENLCESLTSFDTKI